LSRLPRKSLWGDVLECELLFKGVFKVGTASQSGIMVRLDASGFLSKDALRLGLKENNTIYFGGFEADIVIRELLDKDLWQLPIHIADIASYENSLNQAIKHHFPKYWEVRQRSLNEKPLSNIPTSEFGKGPSASVKKSSPSLANRLEEGKAKVATNSAARKSLGMSDKQQML